MPLIVRIVEVVIVGAGPYGLSVAAHMSASGLSPLVFGRSMESWRRGAPLGMHLKSEGFASSLSDPGGRFTLKAFCEAENLPYADFDMPTPVSSFIAYGDAFQRRYVPQLDTRTVREIRRTSRGFTLELEDGAKVGARHVVVATGLSSFASVPEPLRKLSPRALTHTSELSDYSQFAGAKVLVVGAGASATEAAAELLRSRADVTLTCRASELRFFAEGTSRGPFDAVIAPRTPLGPGWKKWGVTRFPSLFRRLPKFLRVEIVKRTLGPASAWSVRREIETNIKFLKEHEITDSRETTSGVEIMMIGRGGAPTTMSCDHVVAGTGYLIDITRLSFLNAEIIKSLTLIEGAPKLSMSFETSVPRLFFVGSSAAYSFGPMLRFVCGADFAARRVTAAVKYAVRQNKRSTMSSSNDIGASSKMMATAWVGKRPTSERVDAGAPDSGGSGALR